MTDRLTGEPIDGSTISFTGATNRSAAVTGGRFQIELPPERYGVSIAGPSHVEHRTDVVLVTAGVDLEFSVLRWGRSAFGASYDETFHRFFHQIARVTSSGGTGVRKWVIPPIEIYLVEGGVPDDQLALVRQVIQEINAESFAAMWCGFGGPVQIISGPEIGETDGRIVVRPNWAEGSTGSLGAGGIRSGRVTVNVFRPGDNRLHTRDELKAIPLHELFHVAFAFHACGGPLGPSPFDFSQTNCPYPDSVMANRGPLIAVLSPQDRLAACLVYNDGTQVGNQLPDTNPTYR